MVFVASIAVPAGGFFGEKTDLTMNNFAIVKLPHNVASLFRLASAGALTKWCLCQSFCETCLFSIRSQQWKAG